MLTESERQWAVNAKMRLSHKDDFCCGKCGVHCYVPYAPCMCVMTKEDVAWEIEFHSRVAAKLASWEQNLIIPCMETAVCERHPQDCPWCRLKYAHIEVEEEMDADRK